MHFLPFEERQAQRLSFELQAHIDRLVPNPNAMEEIPYTLIEASAHCDGPCGVYDPASARIAGEAVQSMTKKMLALEYPQVFSSESMATYMNTMSRYAAIKEEEAQKCKHELLVLWTDFFKPMHLETLPELHETFWNAAKLCSACKVEVSAQHAQELMDAIEEIHNMFWSVKGREVPWIRAS
jgi:nickel superoxide dismutase